jgi:hypothetical protein
MFQSEIKVRVLRTINHSRFLNLYKMAEPAQLCINGKSLALKGPKISREIKGHVEVEPSNSKGLRNANWLRIEFQNSKSETEILYLSNGSFFGLNSLISKSRPISELLDKWNSMKI